MSTSRDQSRRTWLRLLARLQDLADEYGRGPRDPRAFHFEAMHSTLLTLARIAELQGAGGDGWTRLIACAPPEQTGLHARISVSVIGKVVR